MQIEDFEKQGKDEWVSKEPVSTVLGDLHVALHTHDRAGPPDETMLRLANELVEFAETRGQQLIESIYANYRRAEEADNLDIWDVPSGLSRDDILSQLESATLCVSRDRDTEKPYAAYAHVSPNWDLEHDLFLRCADGQVTEFDIMAGEMHR